MKKLKDKLPAKPWGLLALVFVGGIVANIATAPVRQKMAEAKMKMKGATT